MLKTPPRALALPDGGRAAASARMQPGCSVLVRLRLRHVGVLAHRWALFEGTVEAVDHMGASSSQTLGLRVPSLQVRFRVPSRCAQTSASWGSDVEAQQQYLESLLVRGPPGGSAAASGVHVHEHPAPVTGALAALDACWVGKQRLMLEGDVLERHIASPLRTCRQE